MTRTGIHAAAILAILAGSAGAQASKGPDELQRELDTFEANGKHYASLTPVDGLGSTELLLEQLQRESERTQVELTRFEIETKRRNQVGLRPTTIALKAERVKLIALARFLNQLERDPRLFVLESLKAKPAKRGGLDVELAFTAYTERPGTRKGRDLKSRVRAWRAREANLLKILPRRASWSRKLTQLSGLFAQFPQVWARKLELGAKRGLVLSLSAAGSSLQTVSRFRTALRTDPVLMAGLGRLDDVSGKIRRLPSGMNALRRTDFEVTAAWSPKAAPLRLPKTASPWAAALVAAHHRKDHAAVVTAWASIEGREPALRRETALRLLVVKAHLARRRFRAAQGVLTEILELNEHHPEALFLLGLCYSQGKSRLDRARAMDVTLLAARAGYPRVFARLNEVPGLREDRRFLVRLIQASTEFTVSRLGRDPFATPLRSVPPVDPKVEARNKKVIELEKRAVRYERDVMRLAEERQIEELGKRLADARAVLLELRRLDPARGKKLLAKHRRRMQMLGEVRRKAMKTIYAAERARLEKALTKVRNRPDLIRKLRAELRTLANDMLADDEVFEAEAKKILEANR